MDSLPDDKSCARYNIDTMRFTSDAEFTGDQIPVAIVKISINPKVYVTGSVTGLSRLKSNGFDGGFDSKPTISCFEVANAGCDSISYYVKPQNKLSEKMLVCH